MIVPERECDDETEEGVWKKRRKPEGVEGMLRNEMGVQTLETDDG